MADRQVENWTEIPGFNPTGSECEIIKTTKKQQQKNRKSVKKKMKKKILWLQKSLMVVMVTVRICYVNKTNMQLVFLI